MNAPASLRLSLAALLMCAGTALAFQPAKDAKPADKPAEKAAQPADKAADSKADPKSDAAKAEHEIAWKWAKGTRKFRKTEEIGIASSGFGGMGAQNMTMNITSDMKMEIKEVATDGTATATLTYTRIQLSGDAAGQPISFDSDHPEAAKTGEGPMGDGEIQQLAGLTKLPLSFKVSKLGVVSDVSGASAIADKMAASVKAPTWEGMTPEQAQQMTEQQKQRIREQMSDASFQSELESMFRVVPTTKAKVGTNWSTPVKGGGMIMMQMGGGTGTSNLALTDVEDSEGLKLATIKTASSITANKPMEGPMQLSPMQSTGEVLFVIDTGDLLEASTDGKMTMTMSFPMPQADGSTAQQSMTTTMTQKTRLEPITE